MISFIAMDFHEDLDMMKAGCFKPDEPLITEFLLMEDYKNSPCPRFYGKEDDKKKVYHALKDEIHPEVHAKWGHLEFHCHYIPKRRLSKTARNMNKVFLTCGVPYNREEQKIRTSPCKYFQWIHTALYPLPLDPVPDYCFPVSPTNQNRLNLSINPIQITRQNCFNKPNRVLTSGTMSKPIKNG